MRSIKHSLKYIAVFLGMVALLTSMLSAVAMIPRSAIQKNMQESAEFLCKGELFDTIVEDVDGSKIDRYADSILLAIAYQYEEESPLSSVMWSSYYFSKYQNENENLLDAVTKGYDANQQYLRYWHGSNVVVRPLHLLFSIEQIYILNAIILIGLLVWLLFLFGKERAWVPMAGILLGMVLTSSWFVPLSLEYTWTYILMLAISIYCFKLSVTNKVKDFGVCFLVAGMLTNFFDFLTTETLTLLVPLLLLAWREFHRNEEYSAICVIKNVMHRIFLWGAGYVGMWLMKWVLASIVLKQDVMPYVTEHIVERAYGMVENGWISYALTTIGRNISCLFPLEYKDAGVFVGGLFLIVIAYIGYVYHKKQISHRQVIFYGVIGCIPFVRYIVLMNHSYLHAFFTYRALLATVLALTMLFAEVVEWRWLIHANERRRKC
jgi:hypothetical protein